MQLRGSVQIWKIRAHRHTDPSVYEKEDFFLWKPKNRNTMHLFHLYQTLNAQRKAVISSEYLVWIGDFERRAPFSSCENSILLFREREREEIMALWWERKRSLHSTLLSEISFLFFSLFFFISWVFFFFGVLYYIVGLTCAFDGEDDINGTRPSTSVTSLF